jgi:hypothetical protein
MPIKIEKNVPIPGLEATNQRFPWEKMAVGDSFLTDNRSSPYSSAQFYRHENPAFRIKTRKEGKQFRVWRIA